MAAMTYFYQECPTCGRSLRVPVKYFGREMACTHCSAKFKAGKDPAEAGPAPAPAPPGTELLPLHVRFDAAVQ